MTMKKLLCKTLTLVMLVMPIGHATNPTPTNENAASEATGWVLDANLTPVKIPILSNISAIAAGGFKAKLALNKNGTVWEWGDLLKGTTNYSSIPVQVSGLSNIVAISVGDYHCLALKKDGTVWTWGLNSQGSIPIQVKGLSNVIAIAAGSSHNVALRNDGTVWEWGCSGCSMYGKEFRDLSNFDSPIPVRVAGLSNVVSIADTLNLRLALKKDGTVWVWNIIDQGKLFRDGKKIEDYSPRRMIGLSDIIAISANNGFCLVLKNNGTVQIPDPVFSSPIREGDIGDVIAIAAGNGYSLVLENDRTVWAWGSNNYGELGNGTTTTIYQPHPVKVNGLSDVTSIAAGYADSIALKKDGTVWAWGLKGTVEPNDEGD